MKQTIKATSKEYEKVNEGISRIIAPNARGINNKKENLTACSFFSPENNPAEIVIPDLDTPGNKVST